MLLELSKNIPPGPCIELEYQNTSMNINEHQNTNITELSNILSQLSLKMPSPAEQAISIPKISNLAELDSIADDALMQVFWENKETVYSYSRIDIENILAKKDLEFLKSMRLSLCEIAGNTFPSYSEKVPINRKSKNKIANDIFFLGFRILNDNITKEMEN